MDEIDALNEEWNKIKSQGLSVNDFCGGGNSNSSDASSSRPRKKRSRWSDDKVSGDQISNGSVDNALRSTPVITDFSESVCKLVEERNVLVNQALGRTGIAEDDENGKTAAVNCDADSGKIVEEFNKVLAPGPHSYRKSDDGSDNCEQIPFGKNYKSKRLRKYRHKKSDSSSSESDGENTSVRMPTIEALKKTLSRNKPVDVSEPVETETLPSSIDSTETAALKVGPFLEKKTTVVVKNLADWVTASHILQDVKNAQLRSYEDVGIVRKRERGAPYRYAYVDFLTHTSARRWIDIRKGKVIIGSQQYQMELSQRDWECPKCQIFNYGKSMVCYCCRNPKTVLLKPD